MQIFHVRWVKPLLTTLLYGPLKRLGQLSVGQLVRTDVLAPLRPVGQPRALWQLSLRQEARLGARGADQQHVLLQVDGALQENRDAP